MQRTPCVIMRGGTSKGIFIKYEDMPNDPDTWEQFLLDVMGSPDSRQIDGLGGANSLTSKVAIIKKSERQDIDVEYTFGQVSLTDEIVDFKGNCGNISSAVGPYAIDEGYVKAITPVTKVSILNTNTNKVIVAEVEVEQGMAKQSGNVEIPGVPHPGPPVYLTFQDPEGSLTGRSLPSGRAMDLLKTSFGDVYVSIVDCANPVVFVRAHDIGLKGAELPDEFEYKILEKLEEVRSLGAEKAGIIEKHLATVKSPAVPKLAIVSPSMDFVDRMGVLRKKEEMDIVIRMMSMQKPHQSLAITGAICTAVASKIPNSIFKTITDNPSDTIKLAHPAGIMSTFVKYEQGELQYVKVLRTARRIMEGYVYTRLQYI
ncbi:2-methylaconitate cis-trans isomerase PrpF family protein [Halobacillus mangrovi]|uniref:3-methylitaconate isomerase n=1 Tax=Halobacillus mangrovi TaxID=402384 RepID=A0A1W6A157_9BACI|nr:PrpF domain-containing protein [Halobacillus mangrovi]ARI79279.1 3-methylitaconate isomerase [Halobacillus mangrovi]